MRSVVFSLPHARGLAAAAEALERFYAPLGRGGTGTREVPGGAVGWVAFDRSEHERLLAEAAAGRITWGERARSGAGATFEWPAGGLRATPHDGLPTMLYRCGDVVSTHAVAAAWLATHRRPRVRYELVPELLLHEFVLGADTLLEGVEPMAATTPWPATVPAPDAPQAALEALLRTLEERLAGSVSPALGLTGGLDSRVVASALAHLGLPAGTFTWSHHEADAAGAAAVARRLGLPHERCPPAMLGDEDGLAQLHADVRWSEGQARLTPFGRVTWPDGMTAFVTGGGGEIGRAFYYRLEAANHRRPDVRRLVRVLRVRERLPHASRDVVRELEERLARELHGLPGEGWRRLDAFYAQRRVARWGRGMLPDAEVPTVPAFATPAVAGALISMSLRERVDDGFHRHALRVLAGEELPPGPVQRRGVPPPVRRLAARLRRRPPAPARWAYAGELDRRPLYAEWLQDALGTALPPSWGGALRDGIRDREDAAVAAALLASAPVALEQALRDLPERL